MNRPTELDQLIKPPLDLLSEWLDIESHSQDSENLFAFATADILGFPNVRMILLKRVDDQGLCFFSNSESDKGRELAENPRCAFAFYLPRLKRQIRGRGFVELLSPEDADRYFMSRPRESQIGAWASAQSRPLPSREQLEEDVLKADQLFFGKQVPRPDYWVGYRLVPLHIEFWSEKSGRLHDRLRYFRDVVDADWQTTLLYP